MPDTVKVIAVLVIAGVVALDIVNLALLGLGNIPTKTKESSEVWLNGKMFLALLIEKYLGDIDFSPSWNIRTEPECVERDEIGVLFDLYNVTSG